MYISFRLSLDLYLNEKRRMNTYDNVNVIKASGEKAVFDENKIIKSLQKSGASDNEINKILKEVQAFIYDGITTKEIYKKAYSYLKKSSPSNAARYKLKLALFELGPTGYPFEKLIGELMSHQGCKTKVGVIIRGHCVNHEVDVVASKGNTHLLVECKFHAEQSRICNVKVPLYINSRFYDIQKELSKDKNNANQINQGWIVTNTRFSDDAMQYGRCIGLNLVSWSYPRNNSLKVQIDESGLYPVTCLTTITIAEKQKLLSKDKILCKDILKQPETLENIGINSKIRQNKIMKELKELCDTNYLNKKLKHGKKIY